MSVQQLDPDSLKDLKFSIQDGIAKITLNRPNEGNSLTATMGNSLRIVWQHVRANPDVRVIIITAAGERHFCTGAAVEGLSTDESEGGGLRDVPIEEAVSFTSHQNHVSKPIICVVNGLVNGGGLHFVVDADIVIAAEHAKFMDTHVNVGQVGAIENIGIAKRMTLGSALLMTLVGKAYRMPAARAYQLGLVDILEPTIDAAMARAEEFAKAICKNSPKAVSLSKQAIWGSLQMGYDQALANGWNLLKSQWLHPDFAEGPKAFMEKREPQWNPDLDARL